MEAETNEQLITRENYRDFDAINYSTLSRLQDHPSKVAEEVEKTEGMNNGSLLDLFCYEGEEGVHEKYHVSTITQMPSDTIREIIEQSPNFEEGTLVDTARQMDYGSSNWKDSTILKKITENGGGDYMMELENAAGKPIISFEQFTEMQQACEKLKNHRFTQRFFNEGWENQVPITEILDIGEKEVRFKGLLDGKKQKDGDSVIIHDLKYTSGDLSHFSGEFMRWKYYLQSAIYTDLVKKQDPESSALIYYYLVVYSSYEDRVQAFLVSPSMYRLGRNGGFSYTGRYIKGYRELATELLWHQNNNKWDYPYQVYENNGVEELVFHHDDS